ncbi:Stk1 family PASTA domain-containing Ser/Thr kinase [Periweissella beninensis]|uniref:Stk1 family PASTA domain-containing Ser/Thr kinase n=1 Tax=Periweissella beninensis TaxID=504936 RepID=UPI0021A308B5|nr:Stk1 family PASTA domain-containing Ser/Thr kinase [Periweissella beninensis]MCT4396567.1 Stk1 family PASTA domain-containing Ser/Thr kinase [Periweissella beninensis]
MMPNQIIGGRYQIKRPLGEGGMANVYLAHDLILDRDVSLKILRIDMASDVRTSQRFYREAVAATELVHPNIVSLYDYGEDQGMQYLVMEYIDGMDLKSYIKETFPIPYEKVIKIMEQILSAVATAHQAGIIHRDLKPQNILIDKHEVAKISDFGIALTNDAVSMTQTNTILGSVHYLSPEQTRGGMATDRSDVYSLGIILFEMLVGHVPFEGDNAVAIALQHSQSEIPDLKELDSKIPQPMENVVLRATAKDPTLRYTSVAEMATDLSSVLAPQRASEPRFMPGRIDDEATKIIPLADLQSEYDEDFVDNANDPVEEVMQKPIKKKHRKLWLMLGSLMMALLVGVGIFAFENKTVEVPNLVNKSQANAVKLIQDNDLKVGTITKTSSQKINSGNVISATPGYNKQVKKGTTVDLVISSGRKLIRLGDYTGEEYTEVATTLKTKGFTTKAKRVTSNEIPVGEIISQNINAETKVDPTTTTVTFNVSAGPNKITVPDFTNASPAKFYNWANNNNIKILQPNSTYSTKVAKGKIVEQSVVSGQTVEEGDTMRVTLSKGPKKITIPNFIGATRAKVKAWASSNSINLKIENDNSDDNNEVVKQSPSKNTQISLGSTLTITLADTTTSSSSATNSQKQESSEDSKNASSTDSSQSSSSGSSGSSSQATSTSDDDD